MADSKLESGDFVTKRYQLPKNVDPRKSSKLPQLTTLLIHKDAILSSYRWYDSLRDRDGVEIFADRTFSIACGAGWAAEAVRFLKELKKEGIIDSITLSKLPVLQPINPRTVWDECVENTSAMTGRLHSIRDAGFAHFYDRKEADKSKRYRLACNAIEALANGEVDVPFVEWTEENGKKRNTRSCSPFAMMAILLDMFGVTNGKLPEDVFKIGDQILKVGILLEHLLGIMIKELGIQCEPYETGEYARRMKEYAVEADRQ